MAQLDEQGVIPQEPTAVSGDETEPPSDPAEPGAELETAVGNVPLVPGRASASAADPRELKYYHSLNRKREEEEKRSMEETRLLREQKARDADDEGDDEKAETQEEEMQETNQRPAEWRWSESRQWFQDSGTGRSVEVWRKRPGKPDGRYGNRGGKRSWWYVGRAAAEREGCLGEFLRRNPKPGK